MAKIVIENLSHTYRFNQQLAVKRFDLTMDKHEVIALLGPSGCGKSTILRCAASLIEPSTGTVRINGHYPKDLLKKKKIGFAFQDSTLLNWRTVLENIALPAEIGERTIAKSDLEKKVKELLLLTGLTDFPNFYPDQLSGGMKQRVVLARGLLFDPELLLMDEPFGSLDLLTRSKIIIELDKLLRVTKTPTIMVTHSIEEAVFLADRIIVLSPGPCSILEEIKPGLPPNKSMGTFDDPAFLATVAHCRKILLDNWEDENK